MAVETKLPGYTARTSELTDWDEVQEVASLAPPPLTGCSSKPDPGEPGVNTGLNEAVEMS